MRLDNGRAKSWLIYGLLLLGVVARLAPHLPNATPLLAIALFAGTYLTRRSAVLLPLAIVAISDLFLGWHAVIPFTWGAFALTGMLGWWIRSRPSANRILAGTLAGSILFFLITNLGVWTVRDFYPHTLAGLWQCYVLAIPFFRNALLGDLVYVTALFGTFALVTAPRPLRQEANIR